MEKHDTLVELAKFEHKYHKYQDLIFWDLEELKNYLNYLILTSK